MRQFTITACLVIHTAFAFGQIVNDDMTFFNYSYDKKLIKLKKVETLTIQMYFSDGKSSGKTIYHFDKEGLLTRQTIQDTIGILKSEFYFITNNHNDLISINATPKTPALNKENPSWPGKIKSIVR